MDTCRFSSLHNLAPQQFKSLTCAYCLYFIYFVSPPYRQNYQTAFCHDGLLVCPTSHAANSGGGQAGEGHDTNFSAQACRCGNSKYMLYNNAEYSLNETGEVHPLTELELYPPLPPDYALIIGQCCEAAAQCCEKTLLLDAKSDRGALYRNELESLGEEQRINGRWCPATWDGWQCFQRSSPGEEVNKKCPNYIFGDHLRHDFDGVNSVKKRCMENGEWFRITTEGSAEGEYTLTEWTDYSGCSADNTHSLKLLAGLLSFGVTVVAILPALAVLALHRQLKNQAVFVIHRQLLYSFLFAGCLYIFNCLFFAVEGAPGEHYYFVNHLLKVICRVLFTLQLRYMRLSTFAWMLAEGVYLYRLLMCTFKAGTSESLLSYRIAGWGSPAILTLIYSALRQFYDNEECWITPAKFWWIEWTVIGPCMLALGANMVLMLIIFCMLLKKLRFNPAGSEIYEPAQYRKAVRAVFMLMPIFGLHFLITIYRIQSFFHQIISLVLDGLQGLLVALIVCYTNRTVIERLKLLVKQRREDREIRELHSALPKVSRFRRHTIKSRHSARKEGSTEHKSPSADKHHADALLPQRWNIDNS